MVSFVYLTVTADLWYGRNAPREKVELYAYVLVSPLLGAWPVCPFSRPHTRLVAYVHVYSIQYRSAIRSAQRRTGRSPRQTSLSSVTQQSADRAMACLYSHCFAAAVHDALEQQPSRL